MAPLREPEYAEADDQGGLDSPRYVGVFGRKAADHVLRAHEVGTIANARAAVELARSIAQFS
jgi:hypothetical protein